jgi:hypothetical protein
VPFVSLRSSDGKKRIPQKRSMLVRPTNSSIAAARARADDELKKAFSALDPDDFSTNAPAFYAFADSVKDLFNEEAAELLQNSADSATFKQTVLRLRQEIVDDYAMAPPSRKMTKRQRRDLERPMDIDQRLFVSPRDKWDRFAPATLTLILNKKDAVRNELKHLLGKQVPYWLHQAAHQFEPQRPTADQSPSSESPGTPPEERATSAAKAQSEPGRPPLQNQAGNGTAVRTHEPSWEQLADELERRKPVEPLRAEWYAYEGREDYGNWLLRPDGKRTLQVRSTFTFVAARIIEKLAIQPIPVPEAAQHHPHWTDYCSVEEDMARRVGQELDLSEAVPYGLETVDRDAVDPCTRAFLEVLRAENLAFQVTRNATGFVKGQTYSSVAGSIDDLCGAAAAYCKRRARDEIGARLRGRLENVEKLKEPELGGSSSAVRVIPPSQSESPTPAKRKRGRPAKISLEAKQKGLEAKKRGAKGKEIAQLVYGTQRPSSRQVKDARNVLANYERSLPTKKS